MKEWDEPTNAYNSRMANGKTAKRPLISMAASREARLFRSTLVRPTKRPGIDQALLNRIIAKAIMEEAARK